MLDCRMFQGLANSRQHASKIGPLSLSLLLPLSLCVQGTVSHLSDLGRAYSPVAAARLEGASDVEHTTQSKNSSQNWPKRCSMLLNVAQRTAEEQSQGRAPRDLKLWKLELFRVQVSCGDVPACSACLDGRFYLVLGLLQLSTVGALSVHCSCCASEEAIAFSLG